MKIVVCNTHETKGGAAKAAKRISQGLSLNGVDNSFFALEGNGIKKKDSFFFKRSKFLWSRLEQFPKLFHSKNFAAPFSVSKYSLGYTKYIEALNPDLVNLHYVNCGLFSIKDIGLLKKPIVWTLHDSWAFTGGCHLPLNCDRFKESCGNCPVLNMGKEKDLSRMVWQLKHDNWKDLDLTIVSPSKWLGECAKASSLFNSFRVETISNPLDTDVFKKIDRAEAKEKLGLDSEKRYILFGAVNSVRDKNKGFDFLKEALGKMKMKGVELLIFGSKKGEKLDVAIPVRSLGFVEKEEDLARMYSAADLTVIPSISENQPNIAIESLSCGTPICGFDIKGLREIVLDEKLGSLAKPYKAKDLKDKIEELLLRETDRDFLSKYVQQNFNSFKIGKEYKDLFEDILKV